MATRRTFAFSVATVLFWAGCGSSDTSDGTSAGVTLPEAAAPSATQSAPSDSAPIAGFRAVESIEEIAGVWVPFEVSGTPVDGAALGAYLRVTANERRVALDGYDGCNNLNGVPTGVTPPLTDGRLAGMEIGSEAMGCDMSVRISPSPEGMLYLSDDGAQLFADEVPFVQSILYDRVDEVPVDPRQAVLDAEANEEEAAERAEEAEERAALAEAELEARDAIRTELPIARERWAEAGIVSYTLRFENGALMNDQSFPTRRPVGGVWEIEVVDGAALENEWADSILGDTVEDWFAYVESQLDSHHLRVEFDEQLGFPSTIDSQPLDDAVTDPNELVAWIVFAEIDPPA